MSTHNFSTFENLNTLFTYLGNILHGKPTAVELTQAQYNALTTAQKEDSTKIYMVTDGSGGGGGSSVSITTKTGTDTVLGGQFLTINSVETLIQGTGYMEKTQTLSTSSNNVYTFTNAAITTSSTIDVYTSVFEMYPTDVQLSTGQCQVTFEPYSSAVSMSCKIYVK